MSFYDLLLDECRVCEDPCNNCENNNKCIDCIDKYIYY